MAEKKYVSYNMLSIYEECPQKYKFHYIDGLAKLYRQEKPYLSFGESLHKTLEEFFKIRNLEERTQEKLIEILKRVWVKKGYSSEEEQLEYLRDAQHYLEIFFETQDTKVIPFRVEEFFRVPVGDFFLTGRIDRIDLIKGTTDKIEVIDYKTGKFIPKQEEIDSDLQLSIYALGALKKYPRYYPEKLSVYFFQHGQKLTTSRTPQQLKDVEEELITKVALISSDVTFTPRESVFCKTCDYLLICPLMGVASDKVEAVSETRSVVSKTKLDEQQEKKDILEEELKKTKQYFQSMMQDLYALHNYSLDISSTLDIKSLGEKISNAFRGLSGATRSALFLWEEGEGKFSLLNQFNFNFSEDISIEESKIFGFLESCSFSIIAEDSYQPNNPFCFIIDESLKLKNYIVLPLVSKDKVFGLMILADISGSVLPSNKHLQTILTSLCDQAAIAIYNASLYRYAIYDGLTRLFRGSHFQERLKQEMSRVARTGDKLTLIIADIDNFKKINDTFGHIEGDRILREVAKTIRTKIRTSDIAGRYGGEEFVVLLPDTDIKGGVFVAETIRKNISETIKTSDGNPVTASFGVATFSDDMKTPSDFVKVADEALYKAKQTGKNRVVSQNAYS